MTRSLFVSPKPKAMMATVEGKTHRLSWSDRNNGWRMRCSCGWIDPKVRFRERGAILGGNAHITSTRLEAARLAVESTAAGKRAATQEMSLAIRQARETGADWKRLGPPWPAKGSRSARFESRCSKAG
jgi:hypothetical protein